MRRSLRRFSTMTLPRLDALAATLRNPPGRRCFGRPGMRKNFFIGFKAGMLLKTRESRTKYTNLERLFRRKCAISSILQTNCSDITRFEANPEGSCLKGFPPRMGGGALLAGVVLPRERVALKSTPRVFSQAVKAGSKPPGVEKTTSTWVSAGSKGRHSSRLPGGPRRLIIVFLKLC